MESFLTSAGCDVLILAGFPGASGTGAPGQHLPDGESPDRC